MAETVEETLPPLSVCRLYAAIGPAELAELLGWTYRTPSANGRLAALFIPRSRRYGLKTRQELNTFLLTLGCPPHTVEVDGENRVYDSYWQHSKNDYECFLAGRNL